MRSLSKSEVAGYVQEGRNLSEKEGTAILDRLEKNQPQMYQPIFGEFADGIAETDVDMANLFLTYASISLSSTKWRLAMLQLNQETKAGLIKRLLLLMQSSSLLMTKGL